MKTYVIEVMSKTIQRKSNDPKIEYQCLVAVSFERERFSGGDILSILRNHIRGSSFPMGGIGLCVSLLGKTLTIKLPLRQLAEYPGDISDKLFLILGDLLDGIKHISK